MIRLLLAAALLASPAATATADQPDQNLSRWKANMSRHQQVLMKGLPAPYDKIKDPVPDTEGKLRRGAALFDRHCSSCHGWSGSGGGSDGFFLVPAPADLEWLGLAPKERAAPYIYWSISEGGVAFDSEMPAFKQSLTGEDMWSLAFYLRSGMPYASP